MIETSDGESILAWTRYRKGSTLDDIITDTSAEVVIARSWDGLNWSVPEVSSPRDEKRRQMDFAVCFHGRRHPAVVSQLDLLAIQ